MSWPGSGPWPRYFCLRGELPGAAVGAVEIKCEGEGAVEVADDGGVKVAEALIGESEVTAMDGNAVEDAGEDAIESVGAGPGSR